MDRTSRLLQHASVAAIPRTTCAMRDTSLLLFSLLYEDSVARAFEERGWRPSHSSSNTYNNGLSCQLASYQPRCSLHCMFSYDSLPRALSLLMKVPMSHEEAVARITLSTTPWTRQLRTSGHVAATLSFPSCTPSTSSFALGCRCPPSSSTLANHFSHPTPENILPWFSSVPLVASREPVPLNLHA